MFVPLRQEYVLTRNQMARQIRKKSGTGVYHVMLRGINRQDIFEDDEDYQQMVSILRSMTDRHDDDGALMPPLCTYQNPLKAGIVEKTCQIKQCHHKGCGRRDIIQKLRQIRIDPKQSH